MLSRVVWVAEVLGDAWKSDGDGIYGYVAGLRRSPFDGD